MVDRELRVVLAEGVGFGQSGAVKGWLGRPLFDVLPAGSLVELEPAYRAALEGVQQFYEYGSSVAEGMFSVQITSVPDANGVITAVMSEFQDLGERSGVLEELARSEARLHGSGVWSAREAGSWALKRV